MGLYGIVVCGGKSARMGTDKSKLVYYNQPQHDHVYQLLAPFCEKTFISCNADQYQHMETVYEKIPDMLHYEGHGPISALLTAFETFPNQDFLIIGCDYPFLKSTDLEVFLSSIRKDSLAAAFYNQDHKYEPLLAWYSWQCAEQLNALFQEERYALQSFLRNVNAAKFVPETPDAMKSVDTPEDFLWVKETLKTENRAGNE